MCWGFVWSSCSHTSRKHSWFHGGAENFISLEKKSNLFPGLLTLQGETRQLKKVERKSALWIKGRADKLKKNTDHFQDFLMRNHNQKIADGSRHNWERRVKTSEHRSYRELFPFILWANLVATIETTSRQPQRDDLFCCWKLYSKQNLRPLRIKPRLMNFGSSIINHSFEARSYKKGGRN